MSDVIEKIYSLLEPILEGTDMFIINIKMKPVNNIKVYLDADSGLSIEKSAKVNRRLYAAIEEAGMFPEGDFSLEVSSPGVDEPLTQVRQYIKNVGRKVTVTDNEDKEQTGKLLHVNNDSVSLEVPVPKKKETTIVEIPFSNIKKTVVQIIF